MKKAICGYNLCPHTGSLFVVNPNCHLKNIPVIKIKVYYTNIQILITYTEQLIINNKNSDSHRYTFLPRCAPYKFGNVNIVCPVNLLEINYTLDSFLINCFYSSQIFNIVSNRKFECFFVKMYTGRIIKNTNPIRSCSNFLTTCPYIIIQFLLPSSICLDVPKISSVACAS